MRQASRPFLVLAALLVCISTAGSLAGREQTVQIDVKIVESTGDGEVGQHLAVRVIRGGAEKDVLSGLLLCLAQELLLNRYGAVVVAKVPEKEAASASVPSL